MSKKKKLEEVKKTSMTQKYSLYQKKSQKLKSIFSLTFIIALQILMRFMNIIKIKTLKFYQLQENRIIYILNITYFYFYCYTKKLFSHAYSVHSLKKSDIDTLGF